MTKKPAAEKAVSAVKASPAARPPATRKTTVRHKKAAVSSEEVIESVVPIPQVDPQEAIAKIAYGYWEARGYQGGNSIEDWCRAEAEYYGSVAA